MSYKGEVLPDDPLTLRKADVWDPSWEEAVKTSLLFLESALETCSLDAIPPSSAGQQKNVNLEATAV